MVVKVTQNKKKVRKKRNKLFGYYGAVRRTVFYEEGTAR